MPRTHRSPRRNRRSNASTQTERAKQADLRGSGKDTRRMTAVKEAPAALKLSDEQLLEMYYKMLLARTLSIRQRLLQRMGRGANGILRDAR